MKLNDMGKPSAKKINKFMESRFGFSIDYNKMTISRAVKLSETIDANLYQIRHSVALHTAERNPQYMELVTVRENLHNWLMSRHRQLNEGEISNAEVLMAARDMVDTVQDMIKKIGELQNEKLPPLLDSIYEQIGPEASDGYKNSVGQALQSLMSGLTTAREGMDQGVRILSGGNVDDQMSMGGDQPPQMGGDDFGSEMPPAPDMNSDFDSDTDEFGATDAAIGGSADLGRDKR